MATDSVISIEGVSKKYCRSLKRSMVYGMQDIGMNILGQGSQPQRLRKDEFWAVKDVTLEVKRGETLGLVGVNGSGKTTLLKMLNGIFWPDQGKITVRGRVGALIAVGAGFHPLLTGRENIFVNGAILGMGRAEMKRKFDAIVEFSGIEDFLDTPVKHYSSGMFVRLGFAIAIHCDPEILLVDEILAVGDINFQAKCMNKMKELSRQQVSKVFVSHHLNSVALLCDHCLYLEHGVVKHYGETRDVLKQYKTDALLQSKNSSGGQNEARFGTKEITIKQVDFLDRSGQAKTIFSRGDFFQVRIRYTAKGTIQSPEFSVGFTTDDDALVSKATTRDHSFRIDSVSGDGEVLYTIDALPFNVDRYFLTIACWDSTGHVAYDHHEKLYEILIEDGVIGGKIHERFGLVHVPAKWELR